MKRSRISWMVVVAAIVAAGCGGGSAPSASGTRHAILEGLALDYPAGWTLTTVAYPQHYASTLAYLSSSGADASETCGPNYVPGLGGDCSETLAVPAGTAVVRITRLDGPPSPGGVRGRVAELARSGWDAETIDGMPAAYLSPYKVGSVPAGSSTADWIVAAPGPDDQVGYEIAVIAGPGMDPRAAGGPIVSSMRFTPAGT